MTISIPDITVILLAGGQGSRMGASKPKQYLKLHGKEVAKYSFEVFLAHSDVKEIVVVCEKEYEPLFKTNKKPVLFARPGARRQDSVYNGFQVAHEGDYIAVHDSARPCLKLDNLRELFREARQHKAATLANPSTSTLKRVNQEGFISAPLDRSEIWEIQTPQVVEKKLFNQAFEKVNREGHTVTDETSMIGLLNQPVKVIEGSSQNIKLTTPGDLKLALALLAPEVT